jgi:hypothetical protein
MFMPGSVIGTVAAADMDYCHKLRNYHCRELSRNVTIVEAIRATLAFPSLFDSVRIGPIGEEQEFVGIQYRFNNPTLEAIYEVKNSLGAEQPLAGVVSLGCGRPGITSLSREDNPNNQLQFLENMASNCQWTAEDLERLLGPSTPYYRYLWIEDLKGKKVILEQSLRVLSVISRMTSQVAILIGVLTR